VEGIRVFDSSNSQIAELDRLVIPLPLWKALIGKLTLGNVVCDGLSADARYDAQHQLNFGQLVKEKPSTSSGTTPPAAPVESRPSRLPDISGSVRLTNCRATVSEPGKPTVFISHVEGLVTIPNINSVITDALDLTLRTGDSPEGSLDLSGSAAAIRQNQIALDHADIHQKIALANVDLQTVLPFVPASVGVDRLAGTVGVEIAVDVTGGKNAVIDASITGKKPVAIGGTALKGDTFKTDTFIATVPKLTAVFPDGLGNWQSSRIKVGSDAGSSPMMLKVDQGQITALADLLPQSILNLIHNDKPGSSGRLVVDSTFDLARSIPQLRNTFRLPARILLQSGAFTEKVMLNMTPTLADFSETLDTTPIVGMDVPAAGPSRPINIAPIHLAMSTADFGGGGTIPDLRKVNVTVASKSINGQFQGATLADLNGTLTANLTGAMDEVKQFLPDSKLIVAGNLEMKIGETGSLALAPYESALTVNVAGHDLQYSSDGITTASEPMLQLNASADLHGSAGGSVQSMPKFLLTLVTSRIQAPITMALVNANFATAAKSLLDQLQSGHLQIDVPDLKSLSEEARAFSRPAKPATAGEKAPPPVQVAGGSFAMSGDVSHDAAGLKINLNNIAGRKIAFTRGAAVFPAGPVDLKALIGIQTQSGQSIAQQLANINAKITGNLAQLSQLYAASGGEKPDAYPYRGDLTATENVGLHLNTITLSGGAQIAKFQCYTGSTVAFSEDLLSLDNDIALTTTTDDESIAISSLTVNTQSSGALKIALKNGSIHHLLTTRDMQLQPTMDYDLAKLWPIVQPIMGDDYKTLKITGQFQKQFNITGNYPAGQPSTVAIKTLHADGDLSVATLDYDGLNLQNLIVPFDLDNGKLVTVYAGKPAGQNTAAPAVANGGPLDLGNLTIDLTQSPPRLSAPANKILVSKLTINPLFANMFLARYLNNPVFTGNNNASGLLDLALDRCDALPMGDLVKQAVPANTGSANLKFSIANLHIGFAGIRGLSAVLKEDSFAASVNDGTVAVARGLATEHIHLVSGEYSLGFDGTVRLADEAFVPLNLSLGPVSVFAQKVIGTHDQKILSALPQTFNVPLRGTVSHASIDAGSVAKQLASIVVKIEGSHLLGGDNNGKNPLGGLLKGLGK
jgi:hypothetical protein